MERTELVELISRQILGVSRPHPIRVAIDGVDGVGKTTLADELANKIGVTGRHVIRASVDGFHNPRDVRYRLGRNSPEGYFKDSFNHAALIKVLLQPLGPGGDRRHRCAVFDYRTDSVTETPFEIAPQDAVLVFDGVFLLRPKLRSFWDISIFLAAPFEVTVPRMAGRDGGSPDLNAPGNRRYIEGQKIYLRTCKPEGSATMVIDYSNLNSPEIIRTKSDKLSISCDSDKTI